MKAAIVVSGNLRTFFMPTRENGARLCDLFVDNIVNHNDADVFAFADTNDFYLNGTQYFSTDKKIEVLNNDTSRLHSKIDFVSSKSAQTMITEQLSTMCNLKGLCIECPFDIYSDPKFNLLHKANISGNNPALLLHQVRKTKSAYGLLKAYETENNVKYDVILRWRFDNSVNGVFDFAEYDFDRYDVYVPGIHYPVIYDWFALGTRIGISRCLSLYDFVGQFLNEGRVYICSKCSYYGRDVNHLCHDDREMYEITLSVEYHLFRVFEQHNVRLCNARYQSCPYRYNSLPVSLPIDEFMKRLNMNATVVSYSPGANVYETKYTKRDS